MIYTILEKLEYQKTKLDREIRSLQSKLSTFPPGKFLATRNGKYFKWYRYINNQKFPISKKDKYFAEKMAEKNYLMCCLEDMLLEQKALNEHIHTLSPNYGKASSFLNTPSEALRLYTRHHKLLDEKIIEWINTPYKKNTNHLKDLIYNTVTGEKVRSKSEVIIYTTLLKYNIPFHYEEEISFGNEILYPDFTIMHPKTGKIYLWEHFGAIEKKKYQDNTFKKLKTYIQNNYFPTINLITTYETISDPIDPLYVEKLIEYYFL